MTWSISNGESINFLYDTWLRKHPLSQYPLTINFTELESFTVSMFIDNGIWDKKLLIKFHHPMLVSEIMQIILHLAETGIYLCGPNPRPVNSRSEKHTTSEEKNVAVTALT